jgi:hypothetical protein
VVKYVTKALPINRLVYVKILRAFFHEDVLRLFSTYRKNQFAIKLAARTLIQSQYLKALATSLCMSWFCDEWKRGFSYQSDTINLVILPHHRQYNHLLQAEINSHAKTLANSGGETNLLKLIYSLTYSHNYDI